MNIKKLIAGLSIVLITALGGFAVTQNHAGAIPPPTPDSINAGGGGDEGIWP